MELSYYMLPSWHVYRKIKNAIKPNINLISSAYMKNIIINIVKILLVL